MKSNRGFSLLELMIGVGIVSILTAIAIPSYKIYIQRGDRAVVQATLMEAANLLERYKTQNFNYLNTDQTALPPSNANNIVPGQSPLAGTAKYTISMPPAAIGAGGSSYTITATSTTAFDSSKKEILRINNIGQRCISALAPASATCVFGTDPSW